MTSLPPLFLIYSRTRPTISFLLLGSETSVGDVVGEIMLGAFLAVLLLWMTRLTGLLRAGALRTFLLIIVFLLFWTIFLLGWALLRWTNLRILRWFRFATTLFFDTLFLRGVIRITFLPLLFFLETALAILFFMEKVFKMFSKSSWNGLLTILLQLNWQVFLWWLHFFLSQILRRVCKPLTSVVWENREWRPVRS